MSAEGTIIDYASGQPVAGATLDFLHRGGVGVARDSVRVTTEDDGRFRFEVGAAAEGEVLFEVRVAAPGEAPYRVELPLRASTIRGEGRALERWVARPYLGLVADVRPPYRWEPGCLESLTSDLAVSFERTGGLEIDPSPVLGIVDRGRIILHARPGDVIGRRGGFGPVSGNVTLWNEANATSVSQFQVATDVRYQDSIPDGRDVTVGISLNWAGEAYRRSGGEKLPLHPGEIEFRRTGGIEVCPERFVRPVQPWGGFSLGMGTVSEGEVVGDLIIRSDAGPADTIFGLTIPTFRTGEFLLLGRWGVGEQINYVATFYYSDTQEPLDGVDVEFRRTGGIRVQPERFTHTTTDWGGIPIRPHTDEEGLLIGDFHVMFPQGTVVIRNVHVPTFEADEQRLLSTFAVTRPSP